MANVTLVSSNNWERSDGGAIGQANVSTTTFTFALKPKITPFGEGNRYAVFNIPAKDYPILQIMGSEALTITLNGEFHNTRTLTNSAYADRECIIWAFEQNETLTLTLSSGKQISNLVITNYQFIETGNVIGGYAYSIQLIKKATT